MLLCCRKLRWLCISADGSRGTVQADKRTLISKFELGIPIRDMRLLDSTLVTSSRGYIAVRENAIVFAIECALLKIHSACSWPISWVLGAMWMHLVRSWVSKH